MNNKVFPTVRQLVDQVEATQQDNIEAAAQAVAQCIIDGGIVQAWGGRTFLSGCHGSSPPRWRIHSDEENCRTVQQCL